MDKYLILIAGSPATGKSYLINLIKEVLPDMFILTEYCKCIEPPVRRNEPLNARNRASYCEQESHPTIFIYRINLLYNEVACLRA